jgi:isoleucyl-tRNA synthetase
MPFEKVETQVDFPAQERAILEFWQRIDAFNKLRAKNAGKPRWSFLDGPITANNPMGVHHAWGRTYKDAYQRYFAMTGHEERYQNGFDCQGLWVEVEVEKELKLQSKRDIENLVPGDRFASIDRFVAECKARVNRFARVQTEQSIRLGMWMNWDRTDEDWAKPPDERKSYFTMSEVNNYTIWAFLKKCHSRGLIYKAYDSMPWCGRCGTGISQMEMNEGYKLVAHRSIFLRFPLHATGGLTEQENLLVWTTTPWTLTSNVAAAVNPELTYLKVKQGNQIYYVGKAAFKTARLEEQFKAKEWVDGVPKLKTLEQMFKEKSKDGFEIAGEVKGSEFVGRTYDGPFDEFEAQNQPYGFPAEIARVVEQQKWAPAVSGRQAHRVVAWKDVGETEGTSIVHIAPGCGKEDFALGKEQGLPPVAPLDESGIFVTGFGALTGKHASSPEVVEGVIASLKEKGLLFATEMYPHKYPHCWRCKSELLYRLIDEWFIAMSWRDEIKRVVEQITWLPEAINGKARELDWLSNMGDWMISKKRYWGLALPIWVNDKTGEFEVIGSRAELKERAVEGWSEFDGHSPHRPWIDKIKIKSKKTGNLMSRISDVGNPWLDAGIVAYSTMGYSRDRANWEKWYPADFITESFPGQFRNWFYSLLAMSTMMSHGTDKEGVPPFRCILGHASVRDQSGEEMHKSKGNAIEFNGAADSGYKLFTKRNPKLSLEAQAKLDPKAGGLPRDYLRLSEGEAVIDGKPTHALFGEYAPIGADVIRWMYGRHNPSANVNIGPEPADEVRAKFHIKLLNCYAFLCNYARLDKFDSKAPQVPVKQRPDIDRWILSDLNRLVRDARKWFESFDVLQFCLVTESFVDDRLSNWYIRRNRERFQNSEQDIDKLAAYQTLYHVLTTLIKLCAPVLPFLTETMWQNLKTGSDPESIHLCEYPTADESLIDPDLSEEMNVLLDIVSLGGSARNAGRIKVRQPVAEIKIEPAHEAVTRAVERFRDLISEELNVKTVSIHPVDDGPLRTFDPELKKSAIPKAGRNLPSLKAFIESLDATKRRTVLSGPTTFEGVTYEPSDFEAKYTDLPNWCGASGKTAHVAIDTRITPELAREGTARDIIRQIQDQRKNAGLEMEDRITLHLGTESPKLKEAIAAHGDYIAAETLTTAWADAAPPGCHSATVKIDGQALTIALKKV